VLILGAVVIDAFRVANDSNGDVGDVFNGSWRLFWLGITGRYLAASARGQCKIFTFKLEHT
jgi:hypothetical protein